VNIVGFCSLLHTHGQDPFNKPAVNQKKLPSDDYKAELSEGRDYFAQIRRLEASFTALLV
jgi:hypothetical protein